jgi:hypothetical protein
MYANIPILSFSEQIADFGLNTRYKGKESKKADEAGAEGPNEAPLQAASDP